MRGAVAEGAQDLESFGGEGCCHAGIISDAGASNVQAVPGAAPGGSCQTIRTARRNGGGADGVGGRVVERVVPERVADGREVDAQLVHPARLGRELEEGVAGSLLEKAPAGERGRPAGWTAERAGGGRGGRPESGSPRRRRAARSGP